jgi:hypothetical protein
MTIPKYADMISGPVASWIDITPAWWMDDNAGLWLGEATLAAMWLGDIRTEGMVDLSADPRLLLLPSPGRSDEDVTQLIVRLAAIPEKYVERQRERERASAGYHRRQREAIEAAMEGRVKRRTDGTMLITPTTVSEDGTG